MGSGFLVFIGMVVVTSIVAFVASILWMNRYHGRGLSIERVVVSGSLALMATCFTWAIWFTVVSLSNAVTFSGQQVDPLIKRIEQSSTAEEVAADTRLLIKAMEQYQLTSGYRDFLFQNAGTDLGLDFQYVKDVLARAEMISTINPNSPAYPLSLQGLMDAVDQISVKAGEAYWIRSQEPVVAFWWWVAALIFMMLTGIADRVFFIGMVRKEKRARVVPRGGVGNDF